jgi:hypothetical protein
MSPLCDSGYCLAHEISAPPPLFASIAIPPVVMIVFSNPALCRRRPCFQADRPASRAVGQPEPMLAVRLCVLPDRYAGRTARRRDRNARGLRRARKSHPNSDPRKSRRFAWTSWWWTQSRQTGLWRRNSLLTGKRTGNFDIFGRLIDFSCANLCSRSMIYSDIP